MSIFLNPVIISVIVMIILCLLRLNIIFSMLLSALLAGILSHISFSDTMDILITGMSENNKTALSYILLGTLAIAINHTGVADILSHKISKIIKGKKVYLLLLILFGSCLSQNLIPVHIAFIPILIPPLLKVMNKLKIDRRGVACCLTFGLEAPYVVLPVGFGLLFHTLVKDQITSNGYSITIQDVWKSTWILGLAMLIGAFIAIFISYKKDREYKETPNANSTDLQNQKFELKHWVTIISAIVAFAVQLYTGSLPLGAISALILMIMTKIIKWSDMDKILNEGILIMGGIAFTMLIAAGYGEVIRKTGAIDSLVNNLILFSNGNRIFTSTLMILIGLFITLGIGTSFGTVPILATIYVPLALKIGYSPTAMILIIITASVIGDAGSPASDSTLGPTSGLNADGQHNHIKDTCIPTFLHFCIPIFLAGVIGSLVL